ncbi:MAG TPA: hypothetical protein VM821_00350, partial [Abditibacteriaceae bacterium]|nr:hypothetical protein [Abditibacteriaceae bacterium]
MRNQWAKSVWRATGFAAALMTLSWTPNVRAQTARDYVWIEAQDYAAINAQASDKLKVQTSGWGRPEFLSGASWLYLNADAANVDSVPSDGIVMNYKFNAPRDAAYEIWNRVGYEFVRSPFDWRIDGGAWKTATPNDLTTDLMGLQDWSEVAWLKLGDQQLGAGAHTLDIRVPRSKNEKGEAQNLLYASDAIVISAGEFHPNGKWKPGENFRSATDEAASKNVFQLPQAESSTRTSVSLAGQWEIARHDEQTPG